MHARDNSPLVEELTDRELRDTVKRANRTIREIERSDNREILRSGKADETLARFEAAIVQVEEAERELASRDHRSLPERLRLGRALRDATRKPHPASQWLDAARRFSAPELRGETLVADRLTEEDAAALETLVKRKREIANAEHADPLSEDEVAAWEKLLGKAAGDEGLFERKRRDAQANAKLKELKDARKVASLPRQPLLARPGSVQLPRFVFRWLVGPEARNGAFSLADLGHSLRCLVPSRMRMRR